MAGVSEVGRRLRPRWTLFVVADGFPNPKTSIGLSQAVIEGSEAARPRSKNVASSSRRPLPQR